MKGYIKLAINVGDEGGFAPDLDSPQECLELLEEAVLKAGHQGKVSFALDVAASGKLITYASHCINLHI